MKEAVKVMIKKITGVAIILLGLFLLLTPLTPGAWIIFIGLELLGIRLAFWEKLKTKWQEWRKK